MLKIEKRLSSPTREELLKLSYYTLTRIQDTTMIADVHGFVTKLRGKTVVMDEFGNFLRIEETPTWLN